MPAIIDHEERRNELAHAVLRIAATHGVDGVSVRRVATATGYSAGTVQHYFPTRHAMLSHALELLGRIRREQFLSLDHDLPPREFISSIVAAYQPRTDDEHMYAGAGAAFYLASLYDENLRLASSDRVKTLLALLTGILEQAHADGDLAAGVVPSHEASILWGFIDPAPVLAGYRTAAESATLLEYYLDRIFTG